MLMREYDVVVVGGGPAGCMAAKYAAKGGVSTLIIEEDAEIGKPVQCAGLISKRAIDESELKRTSFINCELKGAIIHSHSHEVRIESPSPEKRAFAIDRSVFDTELANEAQKNGADVLLKSKVKGIKKKERETRLTISTAGEEAISARVVIGADGTRSAVSKMAGMNVTKNFLNCVQLEGGYEIDENVAEIFVGKRIAPGFFAWTIPIDENNARIGLCIDKRFSPHSNPLLFLKRNLAQHPVIAKRYKGGSSHCTAGTIPIPAGLLRRGGQTVRIGAGVGIMLVGDAAAQVKPITGGGVYYGLKCGKIAGAIAAKACLTGNMKVLKTYEKRWRKEIGWEIAFGLKVHRLRCVMSDKDFDTIFRTLSRGDVLARITRKGDMDYPSVALRGLLKHPRLITLMVVNSLKYLYTG
jgi:digeranylgeranylglycerophospholipid reductase